MDDVHPEHEILLTAWLRPRAEAANADDGDVDELQRYCDRHGIEIVERHWRSVVLRATLESSVRAFAASVAVFEDSNGFRFRHRDGSIHAPAGIAHSLYGIFGLHQWPRSHRLGPLQRHVTPLPAAAVAERYRFPDALGRGQVIGILQLRGEFREDDFVQCMQAQSVSTSLPQVKRVDNADTAHAVETVKDLEAALDVQIAASLAPGARIVLYQAPDDERGVLDGLRTAIFDEENRPSVISISYGWPEPLWTPAALDILGELFAAAASLGITVFCSSGDNGAELELDGSPHVVAPASVPFAHACGATQIQDGGEIAWERSGGGFSEHFETPPWQDGARNAATALGVNAGRGVPDLTGQESPGYLVYLNGTELAAGGTSAVAPMWSALAARLNERLGKRIGFFAPLLYRARTDWNPHTGLGPPDGTALEALLRA